MLRNFIKVAMRAIARHKAYAFINFIGLSCGLALALLVIAYVRHEMSYDEFHTNINRLYRISYTAPNGLQLASSPPPISPLMKDFFPDVEESGRVYGRNVSVSVPGSEDSFEEQNVYFADSSVMKMFTFNFLAGDRKTALTEKFTVVITEEMSKKYFGDRAAIGESLQLGTHLFKVIGVVKSFPKNSHLDFNMLVPYDNMYDLESTQAAEVLKNNLAVNFIISHSYTYVLLKEGADPAGVDQNMEAFLKKYANPQFLVGQVFTLMPVKDVHLGSTLLAEPSSTNTMTNIYIIIGVGILTLLIASINYINLSTAQSLTRVKEIGIRKIHGSLKSQLIFQFLAESFLFCLVSLALSYLAFYLALPVLNTLTGKIFLFDETVDLLMIVSSAVLLLVITLLAGGYPAYFVTKFKSISALKGGALSMGGKQLFRRVLVVFQLTIACMLLTASIVIVKQLNFLSDRPLGFRKDQIVTIPLFSENLNGIFRQNDSTFYNNLQYFRETIEGETGVYSTTLSSGAPGLGAIYRGTVPEGFAQEDVMFIANMSVDYDFNDTYGLDLKAGRFFSRDFRTDANEAFIVNETAVKEFGWNSAEKAIGKELNREGKKGRVVGVISDFNFTDLTTPISALVMEVNANQFNTLSIRFENQDIPSMIEKLGDQWNNVFPGKAFEYGFLDRQLASQYQQFENFGTIVKIFTSIAVLISCLGVYGLVLFVVQRKVKEIGVRKVLGANVMSILQLIYKDFLILLLMGFILAVPLSWYFMSDWLENFNYRISIDGLTYVVSFMLVLLVVAATISYHAVRASLANPVKSLRSE